MVNKEFFSCFGHQLSLSVGKEPRVKSLILQHSYILALQIAQETQTSKSTEQNTLFERTLFAQSAVQEIRYIFT